MKEVIKALKGARKGVVAELKRIDSALGKLGGGVAKRKARKPRAAKAEKVAAPVKAKATKDDAAAKAARKARLAKFVEEDAE